MRLLWLAGVGAACLLLVPFGCMAQTVPESELDVGSLLYADRALHDPNFAEAVILIIKYDEEGTLGLMLNRPSKITVAKMFDDWKEARGRQESIYSGGPVETSALLALIRSKTRLDQTQKILPGVHLLADRAQLQKNLGAGLGMDRLRIYAGYTGWAAEQLEEEVELGVWHLFPGDASLIFDTDADSLWMRLIKKSETQIAGIAYPSIKIGARQLCLTPCHHRLHFRSI